MSVKLKYIAGAAAAAVIAAGAIVIYLGFARARDETLAFIPAPRAGSPYILLETKERSYPKALSSLLTDGVYAHLKSDTPRGAALAAAAMAEDAAVLITRGEDGAAVVYCAARFAEDETKLLQKGVLPKPLDAAFGTKSAEQAGSAFAVRSENLSAPFYYAVSGKDTIIAADAADLRRMAAARKNGGLKDKKWTQEEDWAGHMEISDGNALLKRPKENFQITIEAAWRAPEGDGERGDARWALVGLDAAEKAYISSALEAREWDAANCILPQPLLLSAGFNMPKLKSPPDEWPFPFSRAAEFARGLGLADGQILEMFSGRAVFSLGGQNKILWFSLPGFLVEFSGRPGLMRELVSAFWENLFFGTEAEPVDGFEFGGAASVPFSVIGAGRKDLALFGLASPRSLSAGGVLSEFLGKDEKAVGWMLADLPRIGRALSEMTNMSTFLEEEDEDFAADNLAGGFRWDDDPNDPEPRQPEISISPFDQEIADSFGSLLERLGRVMIVWEKPLSGRIIWYNHEK